MNQEQYLQWLEENILDPRQREQLLMNIPEFAQQAVAQPTQPPQLPQPSTNGTAFPRAGMGQMVNPSAAAIPNLAATANGVTGVPSEKGNGGLPVGASAPGAGSGKDDLDYRNRVLALLQKIAALESAGVTIYMYYAAILNGYFSPAIVEQFEESRDESILHYTTVVRWMRDYGGRDYVIANPDPEEMSKLPHANDEDGITVALAKAIDHESRAEAAYIELYKLTKGTDCSLENWALDMATNEREDLNGFQSIAGEI